MPDLSKRAAELAEKVEGLTLAVEQLGARTARAERASTRTATAAVILFILVALAGWNVYQQRETADRLESLTQRSLCPVFGLVIGGYNPDTRPAGAAREQYMETFQVMRGAYDELRCTAPLVPRAR